MFIQQNKELIRQACRKQRSEILPDARNAAAHAAAQIIQAQTIFKQSRKVACYLPYKSEFDTQPIIELIWARGKECYLPELSSKSLIFLSYQKGDELVENRYGILEPVESDEIAVELLDIILLPLIAFDGEGHRLGTGGGFYDKTLSFIHDDPERKPFLIGLGFASQQIPTLPADPWDITLNAVLTEKDWQVFS